MTFDCLLLMMVAEATNQSYFSDDFSVMMQRILVSSDRRS